MTKQSWNVTAIISGLMMLGGALMMLYFANTAASTSRLFLIIVGGVLWLLGLMVNAFIFPAPQENFSRIKEARDIIKDLKEQK